MQSPTVEFNVGFIAREVHEKWRTEKDRSYSPFNKPWEELSDQARKFISRQSRHVLDSAFASVVITVLFSFCINDAYDQIPDGPIPELEAHQGRQLKQEPSLCPPPASSPSITP